MERQVRSRLQLLRNTSILMVSWLFLYYEYMLRVSDSVIVGDLITAFHIKATEISLLTSSYYWIYAFMQIPAGIILDRASFRTSLTLAIACVSIGSLLFGITDNLTIVIVARILMGLGSAFSFVGYIKILSCYLKPKNMSFWIGIGMTVAVLGAVSGQAPWLYLVHHVANWQKAYIYASYFGFILAISCAVIMPKYLNPLDNLTMSKLFDQIKLIIRQKEIWLLVIFIALISSPLTSFVAFWAVPFFTHAWNIPKMIAAGIISVAWVGGLFAGPLLGFLADYYKHRVIILLTTALLAVLIMFISLYVHISSVIILTTMMFVLGLVCNAVVVVFGLITERVDPAITGFSIGWANTFNCLSGPFFQMLVGGLLAYQGVKTVSTLAQYSLAQYQKALVIIPILLLAYCIFIVIKRKTFKGEF